MEERRLAAREVMVMTRGLPSSENCGLRIGVVGASAGTTGGGGGGVLFVEGAVAVEYERVRVNVVRDGIGLERYFDVVNWRATCGDDIRVAVFNGQRGRFCRTAPRQRAQMNKLDNDMVREVLR